MDNNVFKYEVSVIVVTYNPLIEKLIKTVISVIKQEGISKEIIICDDGSEINFNKEIESFMEEHNFCDYKIILNPTNKGTIANLKTGMDVCKGEYIKTISPGDYLYDGFTLRKWIDYLKNNNRKWSFSEIVYYKNNNNDEIVFSDLDHPICISPYISKNDKKCVWNYIVLVDNPVGAAMIAETEIINKYINTLLLNGLVYTEDSVYSLMMFDGIVGIYYPESTIFYECGNGISTSHNPEWQRKLDDDWKKTKRIMHNYQNTTQYQKELLKWMDKDNLCSKILTKGKILKWIRKNIFIRKTVLPDNSQAKLKCITSFC